MRTALACLCFALLLRALFDQSVKAAPDPLDLEQAERNLYESTKDGPSAKAWLAYEVNPDLPADAVEVQWWEDVPDGVLLQSRPIARPPDVPEGMVLVRVFQLRREGEGWTFRFLGWIYLGAADVADLHGRLVGI